MPEVRCLARRVLDRSAGTGACGQVEAYAEHRVVTTVQAGTDGVVRHVGRADTLGVGVRVVVGENVGYASTSAVDDHGLDAVVERARANAAVGDADPAGAQLPVPTDGPPSDASTSGFCLSALTSMPMSRRLSMVEDLARRVTALDPRVRRLDTAEWRDEHRRVAVVSTTGIDTGYETGFAELWSDAHGDDAGGEAADYGYWWGRDPACVDVERLAHEAVGRTVSLLGPAAPAAKVDTVVLDPEVGALILDAVGRGLTGGALANRRSPFAERRGDLVAAELVSLDDDGRCLGAPGGAPVDDEGVPRRRTPLIEHGVLTGAMHSSATAASSPGSASTGNAHRSSHKAAPRAAASVLRLGATSVADWRDAGKVAYVQQVSGSVAGISSVTGRVSLGGVGYLVRDGEPAGRLPTLPIATSLPALLTELVGIAGDARVVPGQPVMAPPLLWRPARQLAW